jgi:hypothetical protein
MLTISHVRLRPSSSASSNFIIDIGPRLAHFTRKAVWTSNTDVSFTDNSPMIIEDLQLISNRTYLRFGRHSGERASSRAVFLNLIQVYYFF